MNEWMHDSTSDEKGCGGQSAELIRAEKYRGGGTGLHLEKRTMVPWSEAPLINILQIYTEELLCTSKLSSGLLDTCSCNCHHSGHRARKGPCLSAGCALLRTEDISYSWYYFQFQGQCMVLMLSTNQVSSESSTSHPWRAFNEISSCKLPSTPLFLGHSPKDQIIPGIRVALRMVPLTYLLEPSSTPRFFALRYKCDHPSQQVQIPSQQFHETFFSLAKTLIFKRHHLPPWTDLIPGYLFGNSLPRRYTLKIREGPSDGLQHI